MKGLSIFKEYDIRIYEKLLTFIDELNAITRDAQNYGLTHGDFLFSNYNITTDNKVNVFDFDECEYSWFISDIAICAYYYLLGGNPSELHLKSEEARSSFILFMSGYNAENQLDDKEFERMDVFFKQRDFILLSTIIGRGDSEPHWWDKMLIEGALDRVMNDKPFVDVSFQESIIQCKNG